LSFFLIQQEMYIELLIFLFSIQLVNRFEPNKLLSLMTD
jgi:hypothetical protein